MSTLSQITQKLTTLTNAFNDFLSKVKKTNEFPQQTTLDPESLIRVFKNDESEHVTIQQILDSPEVGDVTYVHNQGTPSNIWNVTHNLGKYPAVTVLDSSGAQVHGNVSHTDTASVVITFSAAFSGTATFN
jgi:hypothetical protein